MNDLVSLADRTHVELSANRRRFRREGVALIVGDRDQRFLLRGNGDEQLVARRDVYVRPAFRGEQRRQSLLETVLEKLFSVR